MLRAAVLLSVLLFIGRESSADDAPIVETRLGTVRGFNMISRSGRKFNSFIGIPYAKPPVGELRFKANKTKGVCRKIFFIISSAFDSYAVIFRKLSTRGTIFYVQLNKAPQPPDPWTGVLDAMEMPSCLQSDLNPLNKFPVGQEDCLYLAVYTHNTSRSVPVLFYIHGGGFTHGDSPKHGPHYLMDEDVVIVGIHYRLNIFGFLSFENSELPGNQGMKDQVMALKWVQSNIHLFGGNPNDVTLIGESAGGASVYLHLVSPKSRGLYHKAISESGTNYGVWALPPPGVAKSSAEKISVSLGCPTNAEDALPCLLAKDSNEFITVYLRLGNLNLAPVFEVESKEAFLVGPMSKWKHNPVPLIIGMTSAEGLIYTMSVLKNTSIFTSFCEKFANKPEEYLYFDKSASKPKEVAQTVLQYYGLDKGITLKNWVNLTTVITDNMFSIPILDGIINHNGPTYSYYFDYIDKNLIPSWMEDKSLYYGASHIAERDYIWNMIHHSFPNMPEESVGLRLSRQMVKTVINFVKYGNPTPEGSEFIWERWTPKSQNFLYVDRQAQIGFQKSVLSTRYNFWKSLPYRDVYDKMELGITT